jgi:hypothetical protein
MVGSDNIILEPSPLGIPEIWDLRNSGKATEAYDQYLDLCHHLSVGPGSPVREQCSQLSKTIHAPKYCDDDVIDFLLFEVSFLRRRLQLDLAESRLQDIKELFEAHKANGHFQFNFQLGLNSLTRGEYSKALDHFFSARKYSRNEKEFHLSYLNMILCMDDLSFEYGSQLKRFEETFLPRSHEPWAQNVLGQYQTLKLRTAYRKGDLKTIQELTEIPPRDEEGSYFLLWILALPHFQFDPQARANDHFEFLTEHLKGHLVPYRMRTLKNLLLEEDLHTNVKTSVLIERFYLWVWRWLASPDNVRLDKIFQLKDSLNRRLHSALTAVDFKLLENACRWLALFLGLSDSSVRSSLMYLVHPLSEEVQSLEIERLALDMFFAARDDRTSLAEDTFCVSQEDPLAHCPHSLWGQLLSDVRNRTTSLESLETLEKSLISLVGEQTREFQEGLIVDMLSRQILKIKGGKTREAFRSTSLTRLLRILTETNPLRVMDALKACFNLSQYEPTVHDPKLANLLSRANRHFAPYVRVTRRDEYIFAEFDSTHLFLKAANPHTLLLAQRAELYEKALIPTMTVTATAGNETKKNTRTSASQISENWVSRQELEGLLGLSRTSTNRKINEWIRKKLVIRSGIGKASCYKLSKRLGEELRKTLERNYV